MGYYNEKTAKTPFIEFEGGKLVIEGRSIPENPVDFYEPLIDEVKKYENKPCKKTVIDIHLDYVNSSSNRNLIKLLSHFEDIYKAGNDVIINWIYDDNDELIKDLGKDFKELLRIPLHLKEIPGD